jgi:hypothetical protein
MAHQKEQTTKGSTQGWVESPFIWLICCDICLARLRKENSPFSSNIYLMFHSPTLPALMSSSIPVTITPTSFMDTSLYFLEIAISSLSASKLFRN